MLEKKQVTPEQLEQMRIFPSHMGSPKKLLQRGAEIPPRK